MEVEVVKAVEQEVAGEVNPEEAGQRTIQGALRLQK